MGQSSDATVGLLKLSMLPTLDETNDTDDEESGAGTADSALRNLLRPDEIDGGDAAAKRPAKRCPLEVTFSITAQSLLIMHCIRMEIA